MRGIPNSGGHGSGDFRQIIVGFLSQPGLPFAQILSAERIERIFTKHGNLFGVGQVYSTAVMVWSFLSQVLRDGKEASCQAAVAQHRGLWQSTGHASTDVGYGRLLPSEE